MKNNQKVVSNNNQGFAPIIIILAILILGGAGYYVWTKKVQAPSGEKQNEYANQNQPTPTAQTDETASWKIFSNSQYGFEFKFPDAVIFPEDFTYSTAAPFTIPDLSGKSYKIIKKGDPIKVVIEKYPERVMAQIKSTDTAFLEGYFIQTLSFHLLIRKSPSDLSKYIKENEDSSKAQLPKGAIIKLENISQNGTEGMFSFFEYPVSNSLDYVYETYYFNRDPHLIIFNTHYQKIIDKNYKSRGQEDNNRIDMEIGNNIFKKIVSTFKFTN